MQTVVFLLGSNLGDRAGNLGVAASRLDQKIGRILRSSSIYESEPWGMNSSNHFYNQCLSLETPMDPFIVMNNIRIIEKEMGKEATGSLYADRTIDIDILFFGERIIQDEELIVPHPRIRERKFAMIPILEIYPDFIHPQTGGRLQEMLEACADGLSVKRLP